MKTSILLRGAAYVLTLLLLSSCVSLSQAQDPGCLILQFADGPEVHMYRDKIVTINAVLEASAKRILSVAVVLPPSGTAAAVAGVERILLAPSQTAAPINCSKMKEGKGRTRCEAALDYHDLGISVIFGPSASGSLEGATQSVADYVEQQVLNCLK